MDIGAWLRGLGLEQYDEAFRAEAIDAEVLPELCEADLEKLGLPLGHRKRLLKAIAALREPAAPPPAAPSQAERRQLTVMFVDLVGSTALSARLDPEEMRELLRAYQGAVAAEIERAGGRIAKFLGDGVLAYFGFPRAREDDAERAVRAGLAAVAATAALRAAGGEALSARVGIATGVVVVGELIGEGAAREEAVVGETPNLAARLQALAEPGTVVIAERTRQLVGGLFDLDDLGCQALKGFAGPVRAWRVGGIGHAEGRFEALRGAALTPLVGREQELALLLDRWARARDGEGQVVLLSGEPGIGKSRLVRALRERLADEPHTPLSYQCSPHHTGSALWPVAEQIERAAGIRPRRPARGQPRPAGGPARPGDGRASPRPSRSSPSCWACRRATATRRPTRARSGARPGCSRSCSTSSRASRRGGPSSPSSRTRTGSTRARRSCSTSWPSGCASCRCCCWSPSGRSTAAPGPAAATSPRSP